MLAQRFTQFVMRSRRDAIVMALLFSMIPFVGWVSAVIIGLVTLRKGIYEGFLILLWVALPFVVILVAMHDWLPFIRVVVLNFALVWFFAMLLRWTSDWTKVIESASIIGVVSVVLLHIFIPDLAQWWLSQMIRFVHVVKAPITDDQVRLVVQGLLPYITGFAAAFILVSNLIELVIAQALERFVGKTNTFKQQWLRLRLSYIPVVVLIVGGLLAYFGPNIFKDILPILMMPFLIAGISLAHSCIKLLHAPKALLISFYVIVVLLLMSFPMLLGILVLAAMIDSFVNIRQFMLTRSV